MERVSVRLPWAPAIKAVFSSMKRPFACLAATQGLVQQAILYRVGARELDYLVTGYPEVKAKVFLDERSRPWQKNVR